MRLGEMPELESWRTGEMENSSAGEMPELECWRNGVAHY